MLPLSLSHCSFFFSASVILVGGRVLAPVATLVLLTLSSCRVSGEGDLLCDLCLDLSAESSRDFSLELLLSLECESL